VEGEAVAMVLLVTPEVADLAARVVAVAVATL